MPGRIRLAEHYDSEDRPKQAFSTYQEAQSEADRRNERDGTKRPLRAYVCDYCGHFHLGHSNPRKMKVRRRKR